MDKETNERARALALELLSGLGVHNLSEGGKDIICQRILDYGREERRRACEEAATIAERHQGIHGDFVAKAIRQHAREERRRVWEEAAKREQMWHNLVNMMTQHDVSVAQNEYTTMDEHNRFVERIHQRQFELMKRNWCRQQAREDVDHE